MAHLDLNLLRVVVAVADTNSVSAAARNLGISQPAASSALARLRFAVGDPLFVKTIRGMEPTPRAIEFVATARELLNRVNRDLLSKLSFDPATTRETFTFAMSDIGEMVFLPKLLDYFQTNAPHAFVRSVSTSPARVESGLESGEIDLAIGYFPDLKKNNYFQQRLFTHYFVCLLRADHPIKGPKLSLAQFLELNHAVVLAEGRSQEIFERFLEKKRIRRKIGLWTQHFMSIPTVIARSDLVVTVPHALGMYFARSGANIKMVKPPFKIPNIELKQHWHRKYHNDPKIIWLREVVANHFNDAVDEWKIGASMYSSGK
ncbi:MAG: LysR family transcriptional regulator [Burkholderiales bacterium]|nr:LysR family transcriptional regulator [Burkholderiales bacterium]